MVTVVTVVRRVMRWCCGAVESSASKRCWSCTIQTRIKWMEDSTSTTEIMATIRRSRMEYFPMERKITKSRFSMELSLTRVRILRSCLRSPNILMPLHARMLDVCMDGWMDGWMDGRTDDETRRENIKIRNKLSLDIYWCGMVMRWQNKIHLFPFSFRKIRRYLINFLPAQCLRPLLSGPRPRVTE